MRPRFPSLLLAAGVLSGLLGAPAMAQPASLKPRAGAARPAPPAQRPLGPTKEEEPAPPPEAPGADADRGLLRALLFTFDPAPVEIRVIAIEDLALLGDARALNTLAELLLDPRPELQLAAVRAVRAFQTPRAEEILENVVRHPRLSERLKLAAVDALPFQRSPTAREFLESVAQDPEQHYTPALRTAARTVLQRAGDVAAPAGGAAPPPGASPTPPAPSGAGTPPPPGTLPPPTSH